MDIMYLMIKKNIILVQQLIALGNYIMSKPKDAKVYQSLKPISPPLTEIR